MLYQIDDAKQRMTREAGRWSSVLKPFIWHMMLTFLY